MKAMILAAGEGRRMRPLTDDTPKPLLRVHGVPLIEHHILRLRLAGVVDIVINLAYLGDQISDALGDGTRLGVRIQYSREPQPLETAGALVHAAPLLGERPFLLINGDVWTDYPFEALAGRSLAGLGHLLMVPNPSFKARGDYSLDEQGRVTCVDGSGVTFAGVSLLSPNLIRRFPSPAERAPLRPVFDWAVGQQALTGEVYTGVWCDVGTPERLAELNRSPQLGS